MKITENMKVCDVLDLNENLEEVFMRHGLSCAGCPGASQETLAEAAEGHSIDIAALLLDLNEKA
ncbi:MAG: DUF1858 domain-containing protein [Emergencia sp.]